MQNHTELEQLQKENSRLRVAVEELSVLNDIATAITSTQTVQTIVELIIQKCVKHLNVEQGAVMLLDEQDQSNPFHTMVRQQDSVSGMLPYRLDAQLTGWMMKNRAPLLINDFETDERFRGVKDHDFPVCSLLSVPMLVKGKMIGLLTVFNKRNDQDFRKEDQRLLSIIAAQSGTVIENARLYQEEQNAIRYREEMRLAQEIQFRLLPSAPPKIPGYQIAATSIPAKVVGGDYYDFIPIDENQLVFSLGDVSGKGIPAALLMANLQATLRGQTGAGIACSACIRKSNSLIHQSTASNKFATLFYGILDFSKNEITYCNAGHDFPFLFQKNGSLTRLNSGGIVVGFLPDFEFRQEKVLVEPGSVLVIYSDGLPEAMNDAEDDFGEKRLEEVIRQNIEKEAVQLVDIILQEVNVFAGNEPQMDDKTIMVIKRLE
ncbi:MAG: GAF domain-containing SpoIIE family protein phosphatase [Calditrichia bacterium]